MPKPHGHIQRKIMVTWDEALDALDEISQNLGAGNHGDLFARKDVKRLNHLANWIEKQIDEYEEARKQNEEG